MTLQERGKKMFLKGYRYCVEFPASLKLEPLFFKSSMQVGPFMRQYHPNVSGYRGYPIKSGGSKQ